MSVWETFLCSWERTGRRHVCWEGLGQSSGSRMLAVVRENLGKAQEELPRPQMLVDLFKVNMSFSWAAVEGLA